MEATSEHGGQQQTLPGAMVEGTRGVAALSKLQLALFDGAFDAMLLADDSGSYVDCNTAACLLLGVAREGLLGRNARELTGSPLAGSGAWQRFLTEGRAEGHFRLLRSDGEHRDVDYRAHANVIPNVHSLVLRDLTERRIEEASARRAEEQLRQAQKMDAVGALAGGVAHDFNNVLSIVLTYTILVMDELKPDDPLRSDLEEVRQAAERAAGLTRQLLALGRQQILEARVLDLAQVVRGMEDTLRRVVSEDIELVILASPTPASVFADPSQMEQIVMNLVVNACEAMPRSGKLTIQTANVELDSNSAQALDVPAGPYVTLAISDTGRGMDAGMVSRIYEPFFTTKQKSQRTGLGLSAVFGIVKQSHGHIGVWSEPGQGTTFRAYFPRTDRVLEGVSATIPPTVLRGAETILLVEDDDRVRLATGAVLRRHGYEVLDAANGAEALLICERFAGRIDLLLTDVVMPRMSGRELADRFAPLRPETAVVYTSGHTEDSILHHGVLNGIAFLPKPIIPHNLLLKVREVLDARPMLPPVHS